MEEDQKAATNTLLTSDFSIQDNHITTNSHQFKADDMVLVVGPPNSGKTRLLEQIKELAKKSNVTCKIAKIDKRLLSWAYEGEFHRTPLEEEMAVVAFIYRQRKNNAKEYLKQKTLPQALQDHIKGKYDFTVHFNCSPTEKNDLYLETYCMDVQTNKKTRLSHMGSSVRAYVNLLIWFQYVAAECSIICIDEPELFLPTMDVPRLINALFRIIRKGQQLIIATHHPAIVQGMLNVERNLHILRFRDKNDLLYLSGNDPCLKINPIHVSNGFDALFHRVSVLVEGDSDVRFYRSLVEETHDCVFIPTYSKDNAPDMLAALKQIASVRIIFDIDFVFYQYSTNSFIKKNFEGTNIEISLQPLFLAFQTELNKIEDNEPQRKNKKSPLHLKTLLKKQGIISIKDEYQDLFNSYCSLKLALEENCKVFLVDKGELERWVPLFQGRKKEFVHYYTKTYPTFESRKNATELRDAWEFVEGVLRN